MLMISLLVLAATPAPRATVAILPPVAIDGAHTWVGMAVADNLANDLLRYRRTGKNTDYAFNVLAWRETLSAARGEGLEVRKPLSPESLDKLAKQLGARYLFTGSYRVKPGKNAQVLLKWRLVDTEGKRKATDTRVTTNLSTLSRKTDALVAAMVRALGERPRKTGATPLKVPTRALKAYASGLEVLAGQSLDPHAQVVLPALELKKARLLFEEATRDAPELYRAFVGLALVSAMLGEVERAEKEVLTALAHSEQFEPQNAVGLYYLYTRRQKPADAIKVLVDATRAQPGFLAALGYLGSAYLRTGDAQRAVEVFRAYKDRVPKSPWARLMYSRALAYAGDADQALAEVRAVQRDFPDSPVVLAALAARLTQTKQYTEAIEVLTGALTAHGEQPELLTRLSYAYLKQGKTDDALVLARRAVELIGDGRGESTAGYAYANLGHALTLIGKKDEAMAAFAKAATLGVNSEARLQLLADEATKPLMHDPANPLAKDPPPAPVPAAPAGKAPPTAVAVEPAAGDESEGEEELSDEAESWDESEEWSEDEDWSEEAYDDEPDAEAAEPRSEQPAAAPAPAPVALPPPARTGQ